MQNAQEFYGNLYHSNKQITRRQMMLNIIARLFLWYISNESTVRRKSTLVITSIYWKWISQLYYWRSYILINFCVWWFSVFFRLVVDLLVISKTFWNWNSTTYLVHKPRTRATYRWTQNTLRTCVFLRLCSCCARRQQFAYSVRDACRMVCSKPIE